MLDRKLSVAPMMRYTDRHFRYLMRSMAPNALLYTEMITTDALIRGDRNKLLKHHIDEHPLAIQIGGNNPEDLAICAVIAEDAGFDEINLNVGCPSARIQSGEMGACMMKKPELVAECIARMQRHVKIPVTIKTRIGIDDVDSYEALLAFVNVVSAAGCKIFVVHARKAYLNGLSPKENRQIPPLKYDFVYRLKADFPHLNFIINGGFTKTEDILAQYNYLDGVMVGRASYKNPYLLAQVNHILFGQETQCLPDRYTILQKFMEYIDQQLEQGVLLRHMSRHILSIFANQPNARTYRKIISENSNQKNTKMLQVAIEQYTRQS